MAKKTFRPTLTYADECHHAASESAIEVLQEINAKYVYGVSYFFLQHDKRDDIYRGVTFFKKSNTDYTRGETIWTVLKIEKRQLENDCCEEIYRRPSYQEMFLDE